MRLDDAALQAIYQRRHGRRSSDACPDAESIWRVATGELRGAAREALITHALTCVGCAEGLRLLLASGLAAEARAVPWWSRMGAVVGAIALRPPLPPAAATVVLFVGIVVAMVGTLPPPVPIEGPARRGGVAGRIGVDPPAGAVLAEAPAFLALPTGEAGESFRAILLDEEASLIWESAELTMPRFELPQGVRDRLLPGHGYAWRVVRTRGVDRTATDLATFSIEGAR